MPHSRKVTEVRPGDIISVWDTDYIVTGGPRDVDPGYVSVQLADLHGYLVGEMRFHREKVVTCETPPDQR